MQIDSAAIFTRGHKPVRISQIAVVVNKYIRQLRQSSLQIPQDAGITFLNLLSGNIMSALQHTHRYPLIRVRRCANSDEK